MTGGDFVLLDQLAQEINVRLDKVDEISSRAHDHRIAAGLRLKQARELVPRGQWTRWLNENIKRSRQDLYRCLRLVESNDPAKQRQARKREQAKIRGQVQRSRSAAKSVSYVCDKSLEPEDAVDALPAIKVLAATLADRLDAIKALILDLDAADFERCKAWFLAHPGVVGAALPQVEVEEEPPPASSEQPAAALERPDNKGLTATAPAAAAQEQPSASSEPPAPALAQPEDGTRATGALVETAVPPSPASTAAQVVAPEGSGGGGSPVAPTVVAGEIEEVRSPQVWEREEHPALPDAPASERSDDGGLMAIWEGLKPNTRKWAVVHVEDNCAVDQYASEPITIAEALVPFLAAARKASREQRQHFLEQAPEPSRQAA